MSIEGLPDSGGRSMQRGEDVKLIALKEIETVAVVDDLGFAIHLQREREHMKEFGEYPL